MEEPIKDKDRANALDMLVVKLSNGWDLTVHWKEKLINCTTRPWGENELQFFDEWEVEKKKFNKHFAIFFEDFGMAALISSAKNDKVVNHDVWFKNNDCVDGFCVIREIDINTSDKLIEIFITV